MTGSSRASFPAPARGRIDGGISSFQAWSPLSQWQDRSGQKQGELHGLILCPTLWRLCPSYASGKAGPGALWQEPLGYSYILQFPIGYSTSSCHRACSATCQSHLGCQPVLGVLVPEVGELGSWSDGWGQCLSPRTSGVPGHRLRWLCSPSVWLLPFRYYKGLSQHQVGRGRGWGCFKTIMKSCLEEERCFPDAVCLGYKALYCFQAVPLPDNPAMIDWFLLNFLKNCGKMHIT